MSGLSRAYKRRPKGLPLSIPGLQLWLDASDASTLFQDSAGTTPATADGDPVGRWADKSGNGKHATQTDGTQKANLKLSIKNSRNVIRFNSTSSKLYGTMSTLMTDCSFVGVCRMETSDSSWRALCVTGAVNESTQTGGKLHGILKQNNTDNRLLMSSWTAPTDGNPSLSVGANWALFFGKFQNTGTNYSYIWVNGTAASGDPKSISSITDEGYQYRIGRGFPTNELWNGDIGELCIYNSALSDDNRLSLQNYLNAKWSIY